MTSALTSRTSLRLFLLTCCALLLGCLVVGHLAETEAHARPAAQNSTLAKSLFVQATKAYADENYPAALLLFIDSYRHVPKPVVLYNIAMCHRALFQYRESIEAFRAYVTTVGQALTTAKRKRIDGLLLEMTAKVARLRIDATPHGAMVKLDGKVIGTAPFETPLHVNPGRHTLEINLTAHEPYSQIVNLKDGELLGLKVSMRRIIRYGFVAISTRVIGAMVTPPNDRPHPIPTSLRLPEGQTLLRVTAPGHRPTTVAVNVQANALTPLQLSLEPLPRRPAVVPSQRRTTALSPQLVEPGAHTRAPVEAPARRPFYRRAWFWVVVAGLIAGSAVTGGVLGWKATQVEPFDVSVTLR